MQAIDHRERRRGGQLARLPLHRRQGGHPFNDAQLHRSLEDDPHDDEVLPRVDSPSPHRRVERAKLPRADLVEPLRTESRDDALLPQKTLVPLSRDRRVDRHHERHEVIAHETEPRTGRSARGHGNDGRRPTPWDSPPARWTAFLTVSAALQSATSGNMA
jgi:hypothetical protein